MKVRITPIYIVAAIVVLLILISSVFTIGSWLGWWGDVEVYEMIQTFILNWVIVITFAIFGGVFFGMIVGVRLLSGQGFTPFEKSMLTMFSKVEEMNERLARIEKEMESMNRHHPPALLDKPEEE